MNHVREEIGGGGEFEARNIVKRPLALSERSQINNTTYFWFTDVCRSALSHYITHVISFMNEDPFGLTQRMLSIGEGWRTHVDRGRWDVSGPLRMNGCSICNKLIDEATSKHDYSHSPSLDGLFPRSNLLCMVHGRRNIAFADTSHCVRW